MLEDPAEDAPRRQGGLRVLCVDPGEAGVIVAQLESAAHRAGQAEAVGKPTAVLGGVAPAVGHAHEVGKHQRR